MTFEYKNTPDPDARLERLMDIIRRDLERQAFVRESELSNVKLAPPPRTMEVAVAT